MRQAAVLCAVVMLAALPTTAEESFLSFAVEAAAGTLAYWGVSRLITGPPEEREGGPGPLYGLGRFLEGSFVAIAAPPITAFSVALTGGMVFGVDGWQHAWPLTVLGAYVGEVVGYFASRLIDTLTDSDFTELTLGALVPIGSALAAAAAFNAAVGSPGSARAR